MRFFALRKKGREVFTYGTKRQSVVSDSALSFCPHLTFTGCFIIPRRFGVVKPSPRCGGGKCSRQASAADGSAKKREKIVFGRRRMASRLGKKRAFPLRKTRATQPAGPKNGSTPRCAVENIRGENESPCVLPALGGRGGFPQALYRRPHSAPRRPVPIAVSFLGFCADGASTRLPQLFSGFVQTASRRPLAYLARRGFPS